MFTGRRQRQYVCFLTVWNVGGMRKGRRLGRRGGDRGELPMILRAAEDDSPRCTLLAGKSNDQERYFREVVFS